MSVTKKWIVFHNGPQIGIEFEDPDLVREDHTIRSDDSGPPDYDYVVHNSFTQAIEWTLEYLRGGKSEWSNALHSIYKLRKKDVKGYDGS